MYVHMDTGARGAMQNPGSLDSPLYLRHPRRSSLRCHGKLRELHANT